MAQQQRGPEPRQRFMPGLAVYLGQWWWRYPTRRLRRLQLQGLFAFAAVNVDGQSLEVRKGKFPGLGHVPRLVFQLEAQPDRAAARYSVAPDLDPELWRQEGKLRERGRRPRWLHCPRTSDDLGK